MDEESDEEEDAPIVKGPAPIMRLSCPGCHRLVAQPKDLPDGFILHLCDTMTWRVGQYGLVFFMWNRAWSSKGAIEDFGCG